MIYVKVALGMMSLNQSPVLNAVPACTSDENAETF